MFIYTTKDKYNVGDPITIFDDGSFEYCDVNYGTPTHIVNRIISAYKGNWLELTPKKEKNGLKFDENKLRWDLLPYDVIEECVKILTFGAKKYGPNNWQMVETKRYIAALMRHLVAHFKGEKYDDESGLLHLSHALTNIVFLIWKEKHQKKEEKK